MNALSVLDVDLVFSPPFQEALNWLNKPLDVGSSDIAGTRDLRIMIPLRGDLLQDALRIRVLAVQPTCWKYSDPRRPPATSRCSSNGGKPIPDRARESVSNGPVRAGKLPTRADGTGRWSAAIRFLARPIARAGRSIARSLFFSLHQEKPGSSAPFSLTRNLLPQILINMLPSAAQGE